MQVLMAAPASLWVGGSRTLTYSSTTNVSEFRPVVAANRIFRVIVGTMRLFTHGLQDLQKEEITDDDNRIVAHLIAFCTSRYRYREASPSYWMRRTDSALGRVKLLKMKGKEFVESCD